MGWQWGSRTAGWGSLTQTLGPGGWQPLQGLFHPGA